MDGRSEPVDFLPSQNLPALRRCILHDVHSGSETLFWKDRWLNGRAPLNLRPKDFCNCLCPNGLVKDLYALLYDEPFADDPDVIGVRNQLQYPTTVAGDTKRWFLTSNGIFSVKSFYNRLNDGGTRCSAARWFWSSTCPRKINLCNCLCGKTRSFLWKILRSDVVTGFQRPLA